MAQYAGIDVSLDSVSVCVSARWPGGRATVAMALCQPEGRWLTVELLETRHVRAAFKAMPAKTDRTDQLMRLGWFRPVHCKFLPTREVRALLTIRKLLQAKRSEIVPGVTLPTNVGG